jgi:hypothetical protein
LPPDATSVDIVATPSSIKAFTRISGASSLHQGDNTVHIEVVAEDGSIQNYSIILNVLPVLLSNYNNLSGRISGIEPGTTAVNLINGGFSLHSSVNVIFKNNGRVLLPTDEIGTGTTADVYINGVKTTESYTVIIYGDLNGDSSIDITDLSSAKNHMLRKSFLQGDYLVAADVFKQGDLTISGLLAIKKSLLGIAEISQNH